eukprot:m.247432 g.247432  ORF g.247432 m.247432 type:complete len:53 (-) comp79220_c0_seq1:14-172(-)
MKRKKALNSNVSMVCCFSLCVVSLCCVLGTYFIHIQLGIFPFTQKHTSTYMQ